MFIISKLAYWNPIGVMIGAVMQLGNLYSVNSWRSENEDEGRGQPSDCVKVAIDVLKFDLMNCYLCYT